MPESSSKSGLISNVIQPELNSGKTDIVPVNGPNMMIPPQANTDEQVIAMWLQGRSRHTQRAYQADIHRLMTFIHGKPLQQITLPDLQAFAEAMKTEGLEGSSCHRILASVKSLIAFAYKIGYLRFDVSRPLRLPKFRDHLAERILSETEVQKIIALETDPRNHLLLRLFYATGMRVSELSRLKWQDLQARNEGGQVTIYGKGSKTNHIIIPEPLWSDLMEFRGNTLDGSPVFKSKKGGHLHPGHVLRIVRKAAQRANIQRQVSPHWFRHSHASHSLERGCPIHILQQTLNHSSIATTGKYLHVRPSDSSSKYLKT
jgi:integrase/recombinase XerD